MTSLDLLTSGGYGIGHPFYDRIYLSGIVSQQALGCFHIIIDESCPAVRADKSVNLPLPTIAEMRETSDFSLISANAILKIEGIGYPVLLRDALAPSYPLKYTCPAGRCENTIKRTAITELNEEILVIVRDSNDSEFTLGFGDIAVVEHGYAHKLAMLSRSLPPLLVLPVNELNHQHYYELVTPSNVVEKGTATIVFDNDSNAYEFCFGFKAVLSNGVQVNSILDGEGYGRDVTVVKTLKTLPIDNCVPALKGFIGYLDD